MKYLLATILALALAGPVFAESGKTPPAGGGTTPPNPTGITLVQQLQAAIAYDEEYLEYHPCTQCYAAYHLNRTQKQLTIALAAAAAGTPFPPRTMENGQVAPITPPYVGTGAPTSASTVAAPSTGPSTTIAKAPTAVREGSGSGAQKSGRAGGSQSASAEGSRSAGASGGSPSAGADTGTPSANPDTGTPSSNPDTGAPSAEGARP